MKTYLILLLRTVKQNFIQHKNDKQVNCKYAASYAQKADLGILKTVHCR